MNTQNAEFLKNSLLNLGFGDKLNDGLESEIQKKVPEFTIPAQREYNGTKMDYLLYFKAGNENEMYFFNKYDARLPDSNNPANDIKQTFYINNGHGVTAKEALNLMEGRAVYKQLRSAEGENYNSWIVLDKENLTDSGNMRFKQFHQNYGFDLEKVLNGQGIKELQTDNGREDLLYSLRKGNVQHVSVERDGKVQKYFIAANPQFKTVDVYDHQMKKVKREELLTQETKSSKDLKQTRQPEVASEKKSSRRNKITA